MISSFMSSLELNVGEYHIKRKNITVWCMGGISCPSPKIVSNDSIIILLDKSYAGRDLIENHK